ncbi:MAG: B-box zinc finger protein [Myxococcaceae bacterium]
MAPEPAATCPNHPGEPAVGSCTRCGAFVCVAEWTLVDAAGYCPTCAAREDVDYLEAFRKRYWGKRDSWGWLLGLGAPLQIAGGFFSLVGGTPQGVLPGILLVASGINAALFWFGVPLARLGLVLLVLVWTLTYFFLIGPLALVSGLISGMVVGSILTTTRTKLFFKMEVPRPALRKCWDQLANNVIARQAYSLSLGGLLVPGMGLVALMLGIVGLTRVNRKARPPVGKLPHAIAAIVIGLAGTALTGAVLWSIVRQMR